jgi:hypothetical protein
MNEYKSYYIENLVDKKDETNKIFNIGFPILKYVNHENMSNVNVGGNEMDKQMKTSEFGLSKLDNLVIPIGLIKNNYHMKTGGNLQNSYHKSNEKEIDVIDDKLFQKLFDEVSFIKHNKMNKSKSNKLMTKEKTRKLKTNK